jgi:transcription termination factor Rho
MTTVITEDQRDSARTHAPGATETGAADTGPASTGPASTGPASTGPASTGPASTSPARAPVRGIVDIDGGHGFIRVSGYGRSPRDIPVTAAQVRQYGLRAGDVIEGHVAEKTAGSGERDARAGATANAKSNGSGKGGNNARTAGKAASGKILVSVDKVSGRPPAASRPRFDDLTPVYPNERLRLENGDTSATARIIDLVSPIGKGQRGLIVAPPKAGKTMVLKTIARAITNGYPDAHLMLLLVGERPEEVTDLQRTVGGEVVASTFDQSAADHIKAAELAIERAKRLAELGRDVVVLLDSLTRLGRAYNLAAPSSSRILSGGVAASALQPPRQFLGAARCLEEGGSLTILSTALIDTGSQLDNVLFEEFKGTGNMELRLRRDLAEKRLFPAIDAVPSGTRRDDLIMDPAEHAAVTNLRRALAALDPARAIELLIDKTIVPNEQWLLRSRTAH